MNTVELLQAVRKRRGRVLAILVGPVLLVAILSQADLNALGTLLSGANLGRVLAALGVLITFHWLKAIRWKAIMHGQQISLRLIDCYWIYIAGLLLGLITPGRLGDFAKVWYLRKLGYSYGRSAVSAFLDRILDLLLLAIATVTALLWYAQELLPTKPVIFFVLLSFALLVLMLFSSALVAFRFYGATDLLGIAEFGRRRIPSKWLSQIREFRDDWNAIPLTSWLWILVMTLVGWMLYFVAIFLLVTTVGLPLNFWQSTAFFALSSVAGYLPISIAGIGTREGLLIVLFSQLGFSSAQALAFSLSILFINVSTAFEGLLGYMMRPLPIGAGARLKAGRA